MSSLIERLIEATAMTDESTAHHKPCDIGEAVRRAIADSNKKAQAKFIDLKFQVLGTPYRIHGDLGRLYRSILNLLDNGIKYTPPSGQIQVSLVYMDNDIVVKVRDTGPGIAEDDLPYLFDRYFPSQPSTEGEVGVGLGLELVRSTVEAHRGSVTARNADGGGAEFTIKLPAALRVG